jgi:metallophosphoesterase (TIGR03768 family)
MRYPLSRFFGLFLFLVIVAQLFSCGGSGGGDSAMQWPISTPVYTTAQQTIVPVPVTNPVAISPDDLIAYATYGYSAWTLGPGVPCTKRTDIASGYAGAPNAARLLTFFSMSDIHVADKESPAQPIFVAMMGGFGSGTSSAYSPVILSTTHVLDAAVQTINALHRSTPFDFGLSLGDNANNTQYNELRWFIDVMDGKKITPSSGANAGASTVDYQMPYWAAGLNSSIPWYAVIGNHDQSWMGSAYENAKTMAAHVGSTILNMGYSADPNSGAVNLTGYYSGVVLGSTSLGNLWGYGPVAGFTTPPSVVADPNRHSLATNTSTTLNWMSEFFNTTSSPSGHGFTQHNLAGDTACHSFVPKSTVPIKVIALDDTCKGPGQPAYAAGCLDQSRYSWLVNELEAGQTNNQLMIIAAHVPLYPGPDVGNNSVPAGSYFLPPPFSVVTDAQLLAKLHQYPNLVLWMSGHRHVSVITPQAGPDAQHSFWEVETPSLRDFPQQFRTFDIRRNTDGTISIVATDVDPAVTPGSPAAKSRGYAIGAARVFGSFSFTDTSPHVYNGELIKELTPTMKTIIGGCGTPMQ